jgi:hypothetical protein
LITPSISCYFKEILYISVVHIDASLSGAASYVPGVATQA